MNRHRDKWTSRAAAALLLSAATIVAAVEQERDLPTNVTGGLTGLKSWLSEHKPHTAGVVDVLDHDKRWKLVLVANNPYSGISALDPYVYGCDQSTCDLVVGSRVGISAPRKAARPLRLVMSKDKRILEVQTPDGVAHVRIRLPRK